MGWADDSGVDALRNWLGDDPIDAGSADRHDGGAYWSRWAWIGVGEVPAPATFVGGAIVLASVFGRLLLEPRTEEWPEDSRRAECVRSPFDN